ncbi:venom serine protease-like [Teleopsis dalmanni]|uniref:venom serine protease-like n=1 Tax=Teleopsis dalmanni TaxID=139649 RepID=UPI000D32C746|nr:venom serine protease-like [Teleopsis dalmanni]
MSGLEILPAAFSAKSLLLLLTFLFAHICTIEAALFDGCDHQYNINAGKSVLQSPYYDSYYPAGTSCRYKFIAPLDYEIQVNCTIDTDKNGNQCSTEFFYLARDGDVQLRGSEQFCGQGTFVRKSVFRSVTMAYVSYGSWGRFSCDLYAKPQACDCGWSVNTRIVNGQETSVNEFPGMVALKDLDTNLPLFCGGSIVAHYYILTAAHCTRQQPSASRIQALVGDHDLSSSTESRYAETYAIASIIEHPGYTSDPVSNDIALLRTVQPIEWSRGVGPICLPPPANAYDTFDYDYVDVAGWGTISFGGAISNKLQKVNLMILDQNTCQQAYQGVSISTSQMCTYDYTGSSRDSCQFDSGGPVIKRGARMFLLGCISFGNICGQGGYATGINTRITSYLAWINANIQYTSCIVTM